MSHTAFSVTHGPTGIHQCAYAFLSLPPDNISTSSSAAALPSDGSHQAAKISHYPNLVVAKRNTVEVYAINASFLRSPASQEYSSNSVLDCVCEYRFHGTIESISVLHRPKYESKRMKDSLIVSFWEAKIVVLEFDDSVQQLKVSSMHSLEGEEKQNLKKGRVNFSHGPQLRTDPRGRCAGSLFFHHQLSVLKAAMPEYGLAERYARHGMPLSSRVSESYTIDLSALGLRRVVDFVFLHGYDEPAIALLNEVEPTWAGSEAQGGVKCTRSLSVLSLNTSLQTTAVLWANKELPHNASRLIAVPSPIGGVIITAAQSIHYCSQASSHVLVLDPQLFPAMAAAITGTQISTASGSLAATELDSVHATWLSRQLMLLSARNGDLLQLMLAYDGRSVTGIQLRWRQAAVLASCVTVLNPFTSRSDKRSSHGHGFVFLGSAVGDSLLLEYKIAAEELEAASGDKGSSVELEAVVPGQNPRKRLKLSSSSESMNASSIYSTSTDSSLKAASLVASFSVCDTLLNIGPITDWTAGTRQGPNDAVDHEIVACVGQGKNGALAAISHSIRPMEITKVELPGISNMWAVHHRSSATSASTDPQEDEFHSYLVLSLAEQTVVLEVGEELSDISSSVEFFCDGPTLFAGNICDRRRVIQIFAHGMRLLDGPTATQNLPFSEIFGPDKYSTDSSLTTTAVQDPYVLLVTDQGHAMLAVACAASCKLTAHHSPVLDGFEDPITAAALYREEASWRLRQLAGSDLQFFSAEDPILKAGVDVGLVARAGRDPEGQLADDVWCILCRRSGRIEVRSLPSLALVWSSLGLPNGAPVLVDENLTAVTPEEEPKSDPVTVRQVAMESLDDSCGRPFLFVFLSDGTWLCYHAFLHFGISRILPNHQLSPDVKNRLLGLRFARKSIDRLPCLPDSSEVGQHLVRYRYQGVKGWFLTGAHSGWVMMFRNRLRFHPQVCDGAVVAFSALHTALCPNSFVMATGEHMHINQLPHLNYDDEWLLAKMPLRCSPLHITFSGDSTSGVYFVAVSNTATPKEGDNSTQPSATNYSSTEQFSIQAVVPPQSQDPEDKWQVASSFDLDSGENTLSLKLVSLKKPAGDAGEAMLAVGTGYAEGEDVPPKGRILMLSPAMDQLTLLHSKEVKGPVTAMAALTGQLVASVGRKLNVYSWTGSSLDVIAGFETPFYTVDISAVKQFVLVADMAHSLHFLQWKSSAGQLELLARDLSTGSTMSIATDCIVDGSSLSLLLADFHGNFQIMQYSPRSLESLKGQKLLVKGEYHTGFHISRFMRHLMRASSLGTEAAQTNRYSALGATLEGAIVQLAPIPELMFKRLKAVEEAVVEFVVPAGGLNPSVYRQFHLAPATRQRIDSKILDMELLNKYLMAELGIQNSIAKKVGTTRLMILNNLKDVSLSCGLV